MIKRGGLKNVIDESMKDQLSRMTPEERKRFEGNMREYTNGLTPEKREKFENNLNKYAPALLPNKTSGSIEPDRSAYDLKPEPSSLDYKKSAQAPLFTASEYKSCNAQPEMHVSSEFVKDDRKDDWLARQRREEERIAKRNGLNLGADHHSGCDAQLLKDEHKSQHGMF